MHAVCLGADEMILIHIIRILFIHCSIDISGLGMGGEDKM
jgi:hypothetical protein